MKIARLITGIITIILAIVIVIQFKFDSFIQALMGYADLGSTASVLVALSYLIAGIIYIVCNASTSIVPAITSFIILILGGVMGIFNALSFPGIMIWSWVGIGIGTVMVIANLIVRFFFTPAVDEYGNAYSNSSYDNNNNNYQNPTNNGYTDQNNFVNNQQQMPNNYQQPVNNNYQAPNNYQPNSNPNFQQPPMAPNNYQNPNQPQPMNNPEMNNNQFNQPQQNFAPNQANPMAQNPNPAPQQPNPSFDNNYANNYYQPTQNSVPPAPTNKHRRFKTKNKP